MSSLVSAAIVAALLGVALFGGCWQIRRAQQAESGRGRIVREARDSQGADPVHDVGPDALLLLQDLDEHLDSWIIRHPDVVDGFARLRQAAEDDRTNKGE